MAKLSMTERFPAARERVYAAWISAEQIRRWFAPGSMTVPEAEVDLRPGGRYRIVMQGKDGGLHVALGQYREIVPNERLAFTWQWEGGEVTTLVELTFRAIDAGTTELTLEHTQFPDEAVRDRHREGWTGCLLNLRTYLSA
jgi:uncharacterized protein YndB with AHSA1/START domain